MSQDSPKFQLSNWEIVSVNPIDKTWSWKDYFCFWANTTQSLIAFSLIASLYILYDLNIIIVFSGSIFAGLLVYFFSNLIGKPSSKHGIPFVVFLRTSIGLNGARYFGILRGFVGIFFFGVQTYFISKSIGYLIRISLFSIDSSFLEHEYLLLFFMGLNLIDWISLLFTLLFQYYLFSKGHKFMKYFINFSGLLVYFGILFFFIILFAEYNQQLQDSFFEILEFENIFVENNIVPFLTITSTMFAYYSIVILNFGDFSRYAKNEKELNKGNLTLLLNLIIFSFLAIFITLGSDIVINKELAEPNRFLTNPTDIIGKILSFVDTLGSFFGPLFGLIICDYYFIKNKKIINKDIFSSNKDGAYYYSNGWHIKGLYAVFIGFIFSAATIWNSNLNFLQSYSWIIGAVVSFIIYFLLVPKNNE